MVNVLNSPSVKELEMIASIILSITAHTEQDKDCYLCLSSSRHPESPPSKLFS